MNGPADWAAALSARPRAEARVAFNRLGVVAHLRALSASELAECFDMGGERGARYAIWLACRQLREAGDLLHGRQLLAVPFDITENLTYSEVFGAADIVTRLSGGGEADIRLLGDDEEESSAFERAASADTPPARRQSDFLSAASLMRGQQPGSPATEFFSSGASAFEAAETATASNGTAVSIDATATIDATASSPAHLYSPPQAAQGSAPQQADHTQTHAATLLDTQSAESELSPREMAFAAVYGPSRRAAQSVSDHDARRRAIASLMSDTRDGNRSSADRKIDADALGRLLSDKLRSAARNC